MAIVPEKSQPTHEPSVELASSAQVSASLSAPQIAQSEAVGLNTSQLSKRPAPHETSPPTKVQMIDVYHAIEELSSAGAFFKKASQKITNPLAIIFTVLTAGIPILAIALKDWAKSDEKSLVEELLESTNTKAKNIQKWVAKNNMPAEQLVENYKISKQMYELYSRAISNLSSNDSFQGADMSGFGLGHSDEVSLNQIKYFLSLHDTSKVADFTGISGEKQAILRKLCEGVEDPKKIPDDVKQAIKKELSDWRKQVP